MDFLTVYQTAWQLKMHHHIMVGKKPDINIYTDEIERPNMFKKKKEDSKKVVFF